MSLSILEVEKWEPRIPYFLKIGALAFWKGVF
jgi:hypothetical protein